MSTTWTLTDLAKIEASIAQGVLEVAYTDRKVTYRSQEELLKLRALLRYELGLQSNSGNRIYARFSKGLNGSGFGNR